MFDWFQLGLTQALCLALFSVLLLYYIYGRGKKYNLPPGPTPLPIIGNVLLFFRSKKLAVELMADLSRTYGPIFRLKLGNQKVVVLSSIDLAREALLDKAVDFAGRPNTYTLDVITDGRRGIALSDYGPTWRLQRKIATSAVRKYLSGPKLEEKLHKSLEKALALMASERGAFDPRNHLSLIVINFISGFCFGSCYDLGDPELEHLEKLTEMLFDSAANGLPEDFLPFLRHLKLPRSTSVINTLKSHLDFLEQKYENHRRTFEPGVIRDYTDCLIEAEMEVREEGTEPGVSSLTRRHFVQMLNDIYTAGVDSTRFTLYWAVLLMACNPDIQDKVHDEIIEVVGRDRFPSLVDKPKLSYTQAAMNESMRLGVVTPIGIPHAAMVDSTIGGYDIPRGTLVLINFHLLLNNPAYWNEPKKFRPERFLNEDGSLTSRPECFIPFSVGRRMCLGEPIAKPELFLAFTALMQRFRFKAPAGETLDLNPTGALAAFTPKRYKICVEPRG